MLCLSLSFRAQSVRCLLLLMITHRTQTTMRREKCVAWTWLTQEDAALGMSDALLHALANTRPQTLTHRPTRTNRRAGGQTELLGIHCLLCSALVPVTSWTFSPVSEGMCLVVACLWTCEIIVRVFESASVFCDLRVMEFIKCMWDSVRLALLAWVSQWPATYLKE